MRHLALLALLAMLGSPAAAATRAYVPKAVDVPGLSAEEASAHQVWNMRAALNVAAIQCQFSPYLRTVTSYNSLLKQHSKEFAASSLAMEKFFKRSGGKGKAGAKAGMEAFDRYNTRTWQSYSTLDAQLPFCDAAARAARDALAQPIGKLGEIAADRVGAVRVSMTPLGDELAALRYVSLTQPQLALAIPCSDRDRRRGRC